MIVFRRGHIWRWLSCIVIEIVNEWIIRLTPIIIIILWPEIVPVHIDNGKVGNYIVENELQW